MKSRYTKFNEELLKGTFDLLTDDIRAVAVGAGYTVNIDTHEFLSSIDVGQRIAVSPPLTTPSVAGGVFNFDNPTFPDVDGDDVAAIVYTQWTGDAATTRLIHYDDEATGLPKETNGSDITHVVADGLFEI